MRRGSRASGAGISNDSYRSDPEAFQFSQRFAQSDLANREGGEASLRFQTPLSRLYAEGVASKAFREAPVDLFLTMFLASGAAMLQEALAGRYWTEAELRDAAEIAVGAWLA